MVWATPAPRLQAYWGWLPPRDPSTGTFWDSSQFSELFPNLVLCLPHGLVPDAYPPLLPSSFLLEGYPESGSRLLPGCTPERTHTLAGALWFRTRPRLQILALPAPLNASFRPHQMLVLFCSQNLLEGVGLLSHGVPKAPDQEAAIPVAPARPAWHTAVSLPQCPGSKCPKRNPARGRRQSKGGEEGRTRNGGTTRVLPK